MGGNVIFRGPDGRQPRTISNRVLAGAYLPGTFVTDDGTTFTQAVAADNGDKLLLLGIRDFYGHGQDVATEPALTPYASGDSGVAYETQPGDIYQVALGADTYAKGDKLTIGASGRLVKAVDSPAGQVVMAYFDDTPGTYAAGALADVEIANAFTMPVS